MSYSWLVVAAVVAAAGCDLLLLRTRLIARRAFWTAYAILFGFQLIVNGVLTGTRIVRYDPAAITGIRLAYAPIEDVGFGFALILLTLSCWVALGRRASRAGGPGTRAPGTRGPGTRGPGTRGPGTRGPEC